MTYLARDISYHHLVSRSACDLTVGVQQIVTLQKNLIWTNNSTGFVRKNGPATYYKYEPFKGSLQFSTLYFQPPNSRDGPLMTSFSGFFICSTSSMAFIIYGYKNPERIRTMIDELFKDQSDTVVFITNLTKNFNQFWEAVQEWISLAVNNFHEIWENLQNRIDKNVPSVEL